MTHQSHTGGCLCGAVRYSIDGPLRDVVACHCGQCRKTSGHYVSATAVMNDDLTITEDGALTWFKSSDIAERGFCSVCGSNLFWRAFLEDNVSVMAGGIDGATGLSTTTQLFVQDAGDYYDIPTGPDALDHGDHGLKPTDD